MIYLASQSPRRRDLLDQIRLPHKVVLAGVDETPLDNEKAKDFVIRIAHDKAQAGLQAIDQKNDALVIAADTAVVVDEQILGKPRDLEHFGQMMQLLSGRKHRVFSGVALANAEHMESIVSITEVEFCELSPQQIQTYWQTGEPADKAGGYGIQGHGAVFIRKINGSYSGVMGLPLFETAELLSRFGVMV